jgi:hypothetical protein
MIFKPGLYHIVNLRVFVYLFISGFISQGLFSQTPQTIKLEEIPQRKVRNYMVSSEIDHMNDFSAIHSSWRTDIDESGFCINEKTFYLNTRLFAVWNCYRHVNFVRAWNGKSVSFGLLIVKSSNSVIYAKNTVLPEADTGQVYFLDLRLLKGLLNIPVAFEITKIDEGLKIIEFSYIDGNKSEGKQTIRFFDNGDGRTRIVHKSYFRSNSSFRDKILYPLFHKKFIREFHENMKEYLENEPITTAGL